MVRVDLGQKPSNIIQIIPVSEELLLLSLLSSPPKIRPDNLRSPHPATVKIPMRLSCSCLHKSRSHTVQLCLMLGKGANVCGFSEAHSTTGQLSTQQAIRGKSSFFCVELALSDLASTAGASFAVCWEKSRRAKMQVKGAQVSQSRRGLLTSGHEF